ncbi:MAG: fibronectin type III domain-containing protein [bacterium]|nr:fibronectin type III domain-containing protein [bacterium]
MAPSAWAGSVILRWKAPGDDNMTGVATVYDIRMARFPILESNWESCEPLTVGKPTPLPSGEPQEITVTGLEDRSRYFFAIRAADEVGNWSPVSNVATYAICEEGCQGIRGNFDSDLNEHVDVADLVKLVEYLFDGGYPPACQLEGNINGDPHEKVDISDLSFLVEYLFRPQGPAPPLCP